MKIKIQKAQHIFFQIEHIFKVFGGKSEFSRQILTVSNHIQEIFANQGDIGMNGDGVQVAKNLRPNCKKRKYCL